MTGVLLTVAYVVLVALALIAAAMARGQALRAGSS